MSILKRLFHVGIFVTVLRAIFSYLDPGSGSLIVQLLVALIVGLLATFRFWKARVFSLFGIKSNTEDDEEEDDEDNILE